MSSSVPDPVVTVPRLYSLLTARAESSVVSAMLMTYECTKECVVQGPKGRSSDSSDQISSATPHRLRP